MVTGSAAGGETANVLLPRALVVPHVGMREEVTVDKAQHRGIDHRFASPGFALLETYYSGRS